MTREQFPVSIKKLGIYTHTRHTFSEHDNTVCCWTCQLLATGVEKDKKRESCFNVSFFKKKKKECVCSPWNLLFFILLYKYIETHVFFLRVLCIDREQANNIHFGRWRFQELPFLRHLWCRKKKRHSIGALKSNVILYSSLLDCVKFSPSFRAMNTSSLPCSYLHITESI